MNRHGNVFAVTDAACDLCDRTFRLTLIEGRPLEGEITPTSITTVCPRCYAEIPVRFSNHSAGSAADDS